MGKENNQDSSLSSQLAQQAVCHSDHPAYAAAALMSAAAHVLVARFGTEGAISLMASMLDEAASHWRRRNAN